MLRHAQPAAELFGEHPTVKAWLGACQAQPAYTAMMAAREAEPV